MKYTIQILLVLLLILFFACDNSKKRNQDTKKALHPKAKSSISETIKTLPAVQFSITKIKELGDSIISYFNTKAGYKIDQYKTTIDTLRTEQFSKLTIKIRTNTYRTHGIIAYDIFTFRDKKKATDFFNDLKTQELMAPFGLNKRPNHILVDSNRVYWHYLEHPYGHRIKELTRIFNKTFNFHPKSTNLDSVSGFTYCRCKNDDAKITGIMGKWHVGNPIILWRYRREIQNSHRKFDDFMLDVKEINLGKDSILIDEKMYPFVVNSSLKLPDNRLFWKYYLTEESILLDPYSHEFETEFSQKFKALKNKEEGLTIYSLDLTNNSTLSIYKLEKGQVFLIDDNKFYELSR